MGNKIFKIGFFYRNDNKIALAWMEKIKKYINKKYPSSHFVRKDPNVLMVLGGDGTILEAARRYHHRSNPMIFGLNLGNVGFLASAREPKNFIKSIDQFFKGKFNESERMMLNVEVMRGKKKVFTTEVLNEVVAQSVLGIVDLSVLVGNTSIVEVKGTGVLVATATGSTAYNLSAHGPIVMPNVKCIIVTEIMDHDIPTPSIVIKHNEEVAIKVNSFRQKGILSISKNKEKVDVVLVADGNKIFSLKKGDTIQIKSSNHLARFVELEKDHFFKSLKDKFSVR